MILERNPQPPRELQTLPLTLQHLESDVEIPVQVVVDLQLLPLVWYVQQYLGLITLIKKKIGGYYTT